MTDESNNEEPTGKVKNIPPGGNILNDSFFEASDIDLSNLGKSTHDSFTESNKKTENKAQNPKGPPKIQSSALPAVKINVNKENNMTKKQLDSLGFNDDDPSAASLKDIWDDMSTPSAADFKLMVSRLEPQTHKGLKIAGYLATFHLPTSIPEIIEEIGNKYGGGRYQVRIVDGGGKYVRSKQFQISGLPKFSEENEDTSTKTTSKPKEEVSSSTASPSVSADTASNVKVSQLPSSDDDDDDDDDEDAYDFPAIRRSPRPRPTSFPTSYPTSYPDYPPFPSPRKDSVSRDDLDRLSRDVEDKILNKIESKFDKMTNLMSSSMEKKQEPLLNSDVVQALAPVVIAWMDGRSQKDSSQSGQLTEMNKQVVSLMQGMQDLVRIGDKSREDFAEKERAEREQARREMLDYQQRMEQRFLDQQRQAEERHQAMLMQMKETLENRYESSSKQESQLRLEYEKLREEFRQREEAARSEARAREDRLREDMRVRDAEMRQKEMEQAQRLLQEERRWHAEMQKRDEDNRRREMEWREEMRQKEIAAEKENRAREMEVLQRIREMDSQKTDMQQKLLEQIHYNNMNSKESQLQMELAIARMTSEHEAKALQSHAQLELEKIRHATNTQMTLMKNDMKQLESNKEEDQFAAVMQKYLQRKLQVDMIKELNMDVDEGDIPSNSLTQIVKDLLANSGPLIQILLGGLAKNNPPAIPRQPTRVVNPSSPPRPTRVEAEAEEEDVDDNSQSSEQPDDDQQDEKSEDSGELNPAEQIQKVADYFMYLKEAVENGTSHADAAAEAKKRLDPQIIELLKSSAESSLAIITQIRPLLSNVLGEDYAEFFEKPETVQWMDKMLPLLSDEADEDESSEEIENNDSDKSEDGN